MNTKDKDLLWSFGAAAALGVLWYFYHQANPPTPPVNAAQPNPALPIAWDEPMTGVYTANPEAYQPASLGDLTINIPNQMANSLSNQYIPMFGFVGVAQGQMYE